MCGAKLLIVADDLTGGLDSGVRLAQQGVSVKVALDACSTEAFAKADADADVLVAVSESRHLAPEEAYEAVYRIVEAGKQAGIPFVYKKTDSALRGNVGAELSAALRASGADMLAFLPAYPDMNRLTVEGRQFIDGLPVSQSVFGRDPFDPVRESDIVKLLGSQTDAFVVGGTVGGGKEGYKNGIIVFDAKSNEDLREAGIALAKAGALSVSAGCGGFAAFLPELLGLKMSEPPKLHGLGDSLLVISGSLNPITLDELDHAEKNGFKRIRLTSLKEALPAKPLRSFKENWMIVDSSGAEDETDTVKDRDLSGKSPAVRQFFSERLAETLEEAMESYDGTVMIIGGDTLSACLRKLGCRELKPVRELFPGVVLSKTIKDGKEKLIISKSGGFGEKELFSKLRFLMEQELAPSVTGD